MNQAARDARYGRRAGRWASQEPGAVAAAFAEYRAERDAAEAAEAERRAELEGQQTLDLFGGESCGA